MNARITTIIATALVALGAWAADAGAGAYIETPSLQAKVDAGELPPVAERLPQVPRVVNVAAMGREPGRPGGKVRMLIAGQRDIRLMTIYGYARIVGYDAKLNLVPDIIESYDVEQDRSFTFKLRPGHKWSDGQPLTAEDFRYCWEDVLQNENLSPGGLAPELMSGGKPPKFEVVDDFTVRYSWDQPNPEFLPKLASAQPVYIAMPAHYLKQFHEKYQSKEKLVELLSKYKAKDWKQLHTRMARQYRPENPELPTLDPWRNTTEPPAEQFVFERNPFYHRVDENGRQLPYVDTFVLNSSSSSIIPAKAGAGEADLQDRYIAFEDYTFLKEAAKRQNFAVKLWKRAQGSNVVLLPNLNFEDAGWRGVLQDARFRRALSLAIDRAEVNQSVFFGLARESSDTVLPDSPLYREDYARAWSEFNPDKAEALLDEMGLDKRGEGNVRLLPDDRPAELIIESSGESTVETDVLELVTDHLRRIGVKVFVRATQRDVLRSRVIGGKAMMTVWSGLNNGIPTADMSPSELVPTTETQSQWPLWGMHYETRGEKGEAPTLPAAQKLVDLLKQWKSAPDVAARTAIWQELLALYSDNVFSIGIVNSALQPIVVAGKLKNVPDEALYSFDPTSYFGVYMPDTFWWADSQ